MLARDRFSVFMYVCMYVVCMRLLYVCVLCSQTVVAAADLWIVSGAQVSFRSNREISSCYGARADHFNFGKDSLYHTRLIIVISAPHSLGRPIKTTRSGRAAAAFVVGVNF